MCRYACSVIRYDVVLCYTIYHIIISITISCSSSSSSSSSMISIIVVLSAYDAEDGHVGRIIY